MQNNEVGTYEQAEAKRDLAPGFRRVPVKAHNRKMSASQLSVPAGANLPNSPQLNRRYREAIHRSRDYVIAPIKPQEPKPFPVKFALKLTTLKLTQLVRRQKKFAREASTALHLFDKMSPGPSRLKSQRQNRHDECLAAFNQVRAEIKARALACEGRLAETNV